MLQQIVYLLGVVLQATPPRLELQDSNLKTNCGTTILSEVPSGVQISHAEGGIFIHVCAEDELRSYMMGGLSYRCTLV